ncbi:hypothetical protein [Nostoc sp.]|uniref:hypothetical protein n=1 Tax=Nostoc sp. TaxID=1180 RepID=UPI002FF91570
MCRQYSSDKHGQQGRKKSYFCDGFPSTDTKRALNTISYIHGNARAAQMQRSFFYDFSNYGTYDQLTFDRLTLRASSFFSTGQNIG